MANEVQSRKQRAAQDILQGNIVTVTNVVKNHIDDFFLRLFQNALVSDVNNPSNKMMRNDQYATTLYMECMTAVGLSPSKFSTVMNILNQYPLLRETVERMKAEGVEAGLMKAESYRMLTGAGASVKVQTGRERKHRSDDQEVHKKGIATGLMSSQAIKKEPTPSAQSFICPLMEELASTVLEITGGKHQTYTWPSNGFHLTVPAGAVPEGITISLTVRALLAESFELPVNSQLMSVIYWISASQCFHQDVTLYLQHCAVIKSKAQCTQFKFVAGKCSQPNFPYLLKMRKGGVFTPQSQEASISVKQFSFYSIVHEGDEDIDSFYCGQGFKKPEGQSWMLDYTITCFIESLVTWVQKKYKGQGWTQHHEQMLEFDETDNESSQPTISLKLTEPVSDEQKNWVVSFVSNIQFPKRVVDRITKKDHLPTSRIGIQWMGLPGKMHSPFARRIVLLGMKGPDNYFEIFLPKKTPSDVIEKEASMKLQTGRKRKHESDDQEVDKEASVKVQPGRERKHRSDNQEVHKEDKHVQKKTKRTSQKAAVEVSSDSPSSSSSSSRESLEREDSDSVLARRLTKPCTDLHLSRIAHSMTEWENTAIYFGIEQPEVQAIKRNYSMSFKDQKYQMLLKWKENLGKAATYKKLIKVFQDLKNQQMVDKIKDIVLE